MFNSGSVAGRLCEGNFLQLFIARIIELGFVNASQLICALMQSRMRSFEWRWKEKVEAMKILKCEESGAVRGWRDAMPLDIITFDYFDVRVEKTYFRFTTKMKFY